MTLSARLLDYATVAVLVAVALLVAFCADDAGTWSGRARSVRTSWQWAARDSTITQAVGGGLVTCTFTKQTAMRLLRDVIEDL